MQLCACFYKHWILTYKRQATLCKTWWLIFESVRAYFSIIQDWYLMPRLLNSPAGITGCVRCCDEVIQCQSPKFASDLRLQGAFMAGSFSIRAFSSKGVSRTHCQTSSAPGLPRLRAAWQCLGKHLHCFFLLLRHSAEEQKAG